MSAKYKSHADEIKIEKDKSSQQKTNTILNNNKNLGNSYFFSLFNLQNRSQQVQWFININHLNLNMYTINN